jgi:hypothetical protein
MKNFKLRNVFIALVVATLGSCEAEDNVQKTVPAAVNREGPNIDIHKTYDIKLVVKGNIVAKGSEDVKTELLTSDHVKNLNVRSLRINNQRDNVWPDGFHFNGYNLHGGRGEWYSTWREGRKAKIKIYPTTTKLVSSIKGPYSIVSNDVLNNSNQGTVKTGTHTHTETEGVSVSSTVLTTWGVSLTTKTQLGLGQGSHVGVDITATIGGSVGTTELYSSTTSKSVASTIVAEPYTIAHIRICERKVTTKYSYSARFQPIGDVSINYPSMVGSETSPDGKDHYFYSMPASALFKGHSMYERGNYTTVFREYYTHYPLSRSEKCDHDD